MSDDIFMSSKANPVLRCMICGQPTAGISLSLGGISAICDDCRSLREGAKGVKTRPQAAAKRVRKAATPDVPVK